MKSKVTPLITQVRNAYFSVDCGMTYVIRTSEGNFVLIDGGSGEYEEADHLWDVLNSQNPRNESPVIDAWFITHPHSDHYGGFVKFMESYRKQVELKRLIYNWTLENVSLSEAEWNHLKKFESMVEEYGKDIDVITPRSGQEFVFGDAIFKVLFVWEDLYPEEILNVNNMSLIMRMELVGRSVLWMGDAQKQSAEYICKRYSDNELKCEIFQVGHHGFGDGSDELHRKVNPEILLWPGANFWFPVVYQWDVNRYWHLSDKLQSIIVAGQAETILDMTKPIDKFQPYLDFQIGEIVYEEKFEGSRVIDLHWSCLTGGTTGYQAAEIQLGEGECDLTSKDKEAYVVCEFVQAGQMEFVKDFTLTITGNLKNGSEKFGLFWNYPEPTRFSEEHALWLNPKEDGEICFKLVADWKNKTAKTFMCNKCIGEMSYDTVGGLHFILKNASITLKYIRVTKGLV